MNYAIAMGNPSDGFYYVGPFENEDHAIEYMGEERSTENMWIIELNKSSPIQKEEKNNYYLSSLGIVCPVCKSDNITVDGPMEQEAGIAWQDVECKACKHSWTDEYKLVGFSNLQSP